MTLITSRGLGLTKWAERNTKRAHGGWVSLGEVAARLAGGKALGAGVLVEEGEVVVVIGVPELHLDLREAE